MRDKGDGGMMHGVATQKLSAWGTGRSEIWDRFSTIDEQTLRDGRTNAQVWDKKLSAREGEMDSRRGVPVGCGVSGKRCGWVSIGVRCLWVIEIMM